MTATLSLLTQLLPLYITIALGWLAGRYLQASGGHIAGIMLYIITAQALFALAFIPVMVTWWMPQGLG